MKNIWARSFAGLMRSFTDYFSSKFKVQSSDASAQL